jgi:hypothetical protein
MFSLAMSASLSTCYCSFAMSASLSTCYCSFPMSASLSTCSASPCLLPCPHVQLRHVCFPVHMFSESLKMYSFNFILRNFIEFCQYFQFPLKPDKSNITWRPTSVFTRTSSELTKYLLEVKYFRKKNRVFHVHCSSAVSLAIFYTIISKGFNSIPFFIFICQRKSYKSQL